MGPQTTPFAFPAGTGPAQIWARWLTNVAAGIDGLVLRGASALIDRTIMPPPEQAESLRRSAAFYRSPELLADPARFFGFLTRDPSVPQARLVAMPPARRSQLRQTLTFRSDYTPVNPAHRSLYARQTENHTVYAELWRHEGAQRPTVICLHGFGMGRPGVDARALMARDLYALGLDVVMFTLPLHGKRTPSDARFSGQAFASPNVTQINEAVGQAAEEIAQLVAWLRARSSRPLGLLGLSLGGYLSALMAGLMPELDFVITLVAPVCFGDLAYRFMSASRHYRDNPAAALDHEEFRSSYWVHCPLAYPPALGVDRLLIVSGRGDRVVPAEHSSWLWEHWRQPRIHWFSGSHLAPFGRASILREIRSFLGDVGVI